MHRLFRARAAAVAFACMLIVGAAAAPARADFQVGRSDLSPTLTCAFFATNGDGEPECTIIGAAASEGGVVRSLTVRHRATFGSGPVPIRIKVFRAVSANRFRTVQADTVDRTLPAGASTTTTPIQGLALPVSAGDLIGITLREQDTIRVAIAANPSTGNGVAAAIGDPMPPAEVDYAEFNGAEATFSALVDTPPNTSISGPSLTNDATPTFGFRSTDERSTLECVAYGGEMPSAQDGDWDPCDASVTYQQALPDGTYTVFARATDEFRNLDPTPARHVFRIDTTPPETTIDSAPSGTTSDNTVDASFRASEQATFECRIDGGSWRSCTSPISTSPIPDGTHTIEIRATDAAGNIEPEPASFSFTINTSAPTPAPSAAPTAAVVIIDTQAALVVVLRDATRLLERELLRARFTTTGARVRFVFPMAGTVSMVWTVRAQAARKLGIKASKPVVIGRGTAGSPGPGAKAVPVKFTKLGKKLMRKLARKRAKLPIAVKVNFADKAKRKASTGLKFTLRRLK